MTEPSTTAPENTVETVEPIPAAAGSDQKPEPAAKKLSLEESLASLDDSTRAFVLGEVTSARSEAKNLRDRLKVAEPKVAEFDRLAAASKTDAERAQEAATAAEQRATAAIQRVARAEVKAALAAVVDDPESIIDDLDLSRFVDSDGEVDTDAVSSLRAKYEKFRAAASAPRAPRPDASQASGANGKSTATPADEFAAILQAQIRGT